MNKLRTTLATAIASTAVVALGGAALAQAEANEGAPPVFFTGTFGEPAAFVPPEEEFQVPGGRQMRGVRFIDIPTDASDDRLDGLLTIIANGAGGPIDGGFSSLEARSYRLANDGGSWSGQGRNVLFEQGGETMLDLETALLTGDGDYAGLQVYWVVDFMQDPPLRGVIYSVEAAPFPDPVPVE